MSTPLSQAIYRRLRPDGPFHMPPPAQSLNALVRLTLKNSETQPEIVLTDTRRDYTWQVVMGADETQSGTWHADIRLPMSITIVTYVFKIGKKTLMERRQIESRHDKDGNRGVYGEWAETPFKIGVYDPERMPADWTRGMVVYQIFPDRFNRSQTEEQARAAMKGVYGHEPQFMSWGEIPEGPPLGRDFYGGDLRGITEKLDYLKELGVECIYLNPIFEAASNHRYEAIDFLKIDEMLGTEADFGDLIAAAHERGIRVVLDAVFNHCSSDSVYFDITGQHGNGATQSKESPYYRWFKFERWPDKYDGWVGLGFMPEFVECPEMEEFFLGEDGVTAYWLRKGIDGWRADVPFDNTEEFWRRFRQRIDDVKPDAWTIAEEWRDATYYLLGDAFNATMNYRLAWNVRGFLATDQLKPSNLDDRLQAWLRDTPAPAVLSQMNMLDSHDTDRMLTVCGGDRQRFLQVMAFHLAYAGAPNIYYGSEAGLEGEYAEDGRRCMPWDNSDTELHTFFKRVMNYRRESAVLRYGSTETVLVDDEQKLYAFARRYQGNVLIAVFNASDKPAKAAIPVPDGSSATWSDILGTSPDVGASEGTLEVKLGVRGFAWYVPA